MKAKFKVNQKVVYPSQGVGKVTEIFEKVFNGNPTNYYKKVKNYSLGMRQRLGIAQALMENHDILILDEPTSGLDPVSRDELIILFQDYVADGEHSILFSTHVTSDLDKCADYITYIKQGKIIESTDIVSYKEKYFLINGKIEELTDELKDKIIGFHKHNFGFEGMILASDKQLFSNCEITKPNLEDIMVHCER